MKQLSCVVQIQKSEFEKAQEIIQQCEEYAEFKRQKEHFEILKGFCKLFQNQAPFKNINEVEFYTHDKQGMNYNLYLLRILYYIKKQKFGKLIDFLPAFEKYIYRHITEEEHPRIYHFSKMLLQLKSCDFKASEVATNQLEQYPYEKSTEDLIMEIIPYEKLWQYILNWL